jgi:hypothetical protein
METSVALDEATLGQSVTEGVEVAVLLDGRSLALTCVLSRHGEGAPEEMEGCVGRVSDRTGFALNLHAYAVRINLAEAAATSATGIAGQPLSIALTASLAVPPRALESAAPCSDAARSDRPTVSNATGGMAVGILYEAWHGFAAAAMANISATPGGVQLTVEDVLRSHSADGTSANYTLHDMLDIYGLQPYSDNFYYQEKPALGFYCIWSQRPGAPAGPIPNCPNVTATLTTHAAQLLGAGVDYAVADSTNLGTDTPEAEVIQVRPLEVLFEQWAALRSAGTPTPAIASWQVLSAGSTLWQNVLDLYNNASYESMVYRDPATGNKVFFVPAAPPNPPNPAILAAVLSNGGRNDVTVVEMWAEFAPSTFADGLWAFFSPCTAPTGPGGSLTYTTSVVGLGRGATGCGQFLTTNSSLGTSLSVSPSYQLSYGSVPFSAANKYDGLTFKRQYGTLFDNAAAGWAAELAAAPDQQPATAARAAGSSSAASGLPDNLFMSSWNEWIAQPQPNPFGSQYAFSLGLPPSLDAMGGSLWVDSYGSSLSRDIEPSTTYGTLLYDIMSSCLRVARLMEWLERGAGSSTGGSALLAALPREAALRALLAAFGADTAASAAGVRPLSSCAVAGEVCCAFNASTDDYNPVWALTLNGGGDALLTTAVAEVDALTCAGCGWSQNCNPYGTATDFCTDAGVLAGPAALQGPFVLYAGGCGLPVVPGGPPADPTLPGRTPLVRCYDGKHHSFTTATACPAGAALESVLGCLAATPSSNMARAFRKCATSTGGGGGVVYHVMDGACAAGDSDAGVLGFVR